MPSDSSFLNDSLSFCCKWRAVWCLETEGKSIGVTSTPWPWDRAWLLQILLFWCAELNRNRFIKEVPVRIRSLDAMSKRTSSLTLRKQRWAWQWGWWQCAAKCKVGVAAAGERWEKKENFRWVSGGVRLCKGGRRRNRRQRRGVGRMNASALGYISFSFFLSSF